MLMEGAMRGKIHHAGYLVDNLDSVVAWYEKTFEGKQTASGDTPGGGKVAFVRLGDGEVELIQPGIRLIWADVAGLTTTSATWWMTWTRRWSSLKPRGSNSPRIPQ